jgi:uncharacterized RDD family membrane protein YckC
LARDLDAANIGGNGMSEVVTGEAVVLDLAIARFPSRIVAQLIDIAVQLPVLIFILVVVGSKASQHLNAASAAALTIIGIVFVVVAYPATFETLSRGKTLGKLAMGLRVVSDDGGPERFRQALIRALSAAFLEIWLPPFILIGMPAGLITSMVSARGKRLGDVFAGSFVIQERVPGRRDLPPIFEMIAPPLREWAAYLELSTLPDQLAATASSYLRRYKELRPASRAQLGLQLATSVSAYVSPPPPPGTPPEAYLSAVLAVRRQRELARQQAQGSPFPQPPFTPQSQFTAAQSPTPTGPPATLPTATQPIPPGGFQPPIAPADAPADAQPTDVLPANAPPADAPPAETQPENYGFTAPL